MQLVISEDGCYIVSQNWRDWMSERTHVEKYCLPEYWMHVRTYFDGKKGVTANERETGVLRDDKVERGRLKDLEIKG